jgi:hypothetical protein
MRVILSWDAPRAQARIGDMRIRRRWMWRVGLVSVAGAAALLAATPAAAAAPRTTGMSVSSAGAQDNGLSAGESISAGGRFVAFASNATDLVPGATFTTQVYLRDRVRGRTTLLSQAPSGIEGDGSSGDLAVSISGDGTALSSRERASLDRAEAQDPTGAAERTVRNDLRGLADAGAIRRGADGRYLLASHARRGAGRPRVWTDERIEQELRRLMIVQGALPTAAELQRDHSALHRVIGRRGGLRKWRARLEGR